MMTGSAILLFMLISNVRFMKVINWNFNSVSFTFTLTSAVCERSYLFKLHTKMYKVHNI